MTYTNGFTVYYLKKSDMFTIKFHWDIFQQAITWTNVDPDLCRHMASLGLNELTFLTHGNKTKSKLRIKKIAKIPNF